MEGADEWSKSLEDLEVDHHLPHLAGWGGCLDEQVMVVASMNWCLEVKSEAQLMILSFGGDSHHQEGRKQRRKELPVKTLVNTAS